MITAYRKPWTLGGLPPPVILGGRAAAPLFLLHCELTYITANNGCSVTTCTCCHTRKAESCSDLAPCICCMRPLTVRSRGQEKLRTTHQYGSSIIMWQCVNFSFHNTGQYTSITKCQNHHLYSPITSYTLLQSSSASGWQLASKFCVWNSYCGVCIVVCDANICVGKYLPGSTFDQVLCVLWTHKRHCCKSNSCLCSASSWQTSLQPLSQWFNFQCRASFFFPLFSFSHTTQ